MRFELMDYLAVGVGYGASLGGWYGITRAFPSLWVEGAEPRFAKPRSELGWALLAAVGVMLLSTAYTLWMPQSLTGLAREGVFWVALLIIWSPVFLVLALRRQGLETCFMSPRGLPVKLAWGIVASLIGVTAYLLVKRQLAEPGQILEAFRGVRLTPLFQGLLQFFGFGFLLARLVAVLGRGWGSVLCGALYGLAKYPLYMTVYGMDFATATAVIAFSALVAGLAIYLVTDRKDLLVPALVHTLMDQVQQL